MIGGILDTFVVRVCSKFSLRDFTLRVSIYLQGGDIYHESGISILDNTLQIIWII